jgi:hypothetical protein
VAQDPALARGGHHEHVALATRILLARSKADCDLCNIRKNVNKKLATGKKLTTNTVKKLKRLNELVPFFS